jgi:plastocyanin
MSRKMSCQVYLMGCTINDMRLSQANIKKIALSLSAVVIVGGVVVGTAFLIIQTQQRNQKSFGDLSVPAPGTAPQTVPAASSSSIPFDQSKLPDFLKPPAQRVPNKNIQLKPDPTEEEIREYIGKVERAAVSAASVRIDGCQPDPVVVRASSSASLLFVNSDKSTHLITVEDKKFAIEPEDERDIPMSFASGTGIYNYDCDSHFSVGTLLVE